MNLSKKITFVFLFTLVLSNYAQLSREFNGIKMNDTIISVLPKLKEISASLVVTHIDNPVFPLSKDTETHVVANRINTTKGLIDKMVMTFADGNLKYVEAKGNVQNTLVSEQDSVFKYLNWDVYLEKKLVVDSKDDTAWFLSEEAAFLNLFTWKNPILDDNRNRNVIIDKIPDFLKIGATVEELKPVLEKNSRFIAEQKLDGSDPNAQFQINAFGYEYLGFPRKFEARFGDGVLNVVWILTGKAEEDRIRKALTKQYGKPIYVNGNWEIFNDWKVGLRKDKPEILLIKREIAMQYKNSFFKE